MSTTHRAALLALAFAVAAPTAAGARLHRKPAPWLEERLARAPAGPKRLALATEVARRQDPALIPVLVAAATSDPERAVRLVALEGLVGFGGALADPGRDTAYLQALETGDVGALRIVKKGITERMRAGEPPGLEALADQLHTLARTGEGWRTRKVALAALQPRAGASLVPTLAAVAAQDPHPEVRRAAAEALGSVPDGGQRAVLVRLRKADPDAQVRLAAERALARLGGPESNLVIAVLPFETADPRLRGTAQELQSTMTTALDLAGSGRVVERGQLDAVFAELRLQAGALGEGEAVELGRLLRADTIVTGTLQRSGDEVRCLAKRIEVATGRVQAAPVVAGALHDLGALQQACAERLAGSL